MRLVCPLKVGCYNERHGDCETITGVWYPAGAGRLADRPRPRRLLRPGLARRALPRLPPPRRAVRALPPGRLLEAHARVGRCPRVRTPRRDRLPPRPTPAPRTAALRHQERKPPRPP